MADPRSLALALGVLPFLGFVLVYAKARIAARRDAAWGSLAGIVAFLGLGHAMAAVLLDSALLSRSIGEATGIVLSVVGLGSGLAAAWWILESPSTAMGFGTARVAWAAAAYLALHSIADGLVLGEAFIGPAPSVPLDVATIGATVIHRGAEGALVVVPALLAGWRGSKILGALSAGLLAIPAAAFVGFVFGTGGPFTSAIVHLAAVTVAAGVEAGFALVLLAAALVPRAIEAGRGRWIAWMAGAFVLLALVHGLVE
ncbi:MAG TPA: hypothetical protein VJ326_04720 [Thermoplasmata archaeon]|nr:hypothetical protein [Thermoplasmata archaeon]